MKDLVIIVPFYQGHRFLPKLLNTIPETISVIVVNDRSPGGEIDVSKWNNARVVTTREHGYFGGACNRGFEELKPGQHALILNQDTWFTGDGWITQLEKQSKHAAIIGDFVRPNKWHRAGYVQGTFMFIRSDALQQLGQFDANAYPHWGVTCLYQMRACRAGFVAQKLHGLKKWFHHARDRQRGQRRYGSATTQILARSNRKLQRRLIVTPPLVSVVIPNFNKAPYIAEALDSLLKHSIYQDFEVCIVDDGSTDNSREVLHEYLSQWGEIKKKTPKNNQVIKERWDSPFIYVRVLWAKRQGVPHARNLGVSNTIAPLIFQLDADDKVHPNGLGRMVSAIARNPERWVYTDLQCFGESNSRREFQEFDVPHPAAIAERNVAPSCILYHRLWWREVGGYHPATKRGHDDWGFGIQLFLAKHCGQRLQGVDGDITPAVYYRKTTGSRNATSRRRVKELIATRKRLWPKAFDMLKEGVDPMGCCSGKVTSRRSSASMAKQLTDTNLGPKILVTYTGKATASFPALGSETGTRYTITPRKPFEIYERDLRYLTKVGVRRVQPPQVYDPAASQKAPAAKPATEIMAEQMLAGGNGDEVDESEIADMTDEALEAILAGTIPDIMDKAQDLEQTDIIQLILLETGGKNRITLIDKLEDLIGYESQPVEGVNEPD